MSRFRLHDWNDVKLLLACAERGGFAGAAAALGLDQTTVSRRIGNLEAAVGRPLFNRRRSGATPTLVGEALIARARSLAGAITEFEGAMNGLAAMPPPTVTIAASEGVLTYLVIPALLGSNAAELPLNRALLKSAPPSLAFTSPGNKADITVLATNPSDLPDVRGAIRVRKVGTMTFVPVTSRRLAQRTPTISHFDDLRAHPVLDNLIYRGLKSFDEWHELIGGLPEGPVLTGRTTTEVHMQLAAGMGFTILPGYSGLYDARLMTLDIPSPRFAVDLWLIAHEDSLREPVIRELYDTLARMFLESHWFRG